MKKWLLIPILVILIFLFCCQKQKEVEQAELRTESGIAEPAAIAQTIGKNLDLAVENLEKGQLGEGASLLLDSVLLVKPQDRWPEGFVGNISAAKDQFTEGNISAAVGSISKALSLIKKTDESGQSTDSGEIAPLGAIMKGKITEAKEEFIKGNGDQGVIALLEALQLAAPQK
jgi:hypothetical protein